MLEADRRDDADLFLVEDIRGVQPASEAYFEHLPIDLSFSEVEEGQYD